MTMTDERTLHLREREAGSSGASAPAMLSTQEAATYLGTTPGMLSLSRHTGELFKGVPGPRFIKLGKRTVRYLRKDLDEWIDQHRRYGSNAEVSVSRKE